jgi:hypothetical protein
MDAWITGVGFCETHHMAAPTRFEMEKKRPMMGTLSRNAAAKPNAGVCELERNDSRA